MNEANRVRAGVGWGALLGGALFLGGCGAKEAYFTGSRDPWENVFCSDETQRAEKRDDGVWYCPWGAAYDENSVGWIDEAGTYLPRSTVHSTGAWVNFCESMALVSYGGPGLEDDAPWLVFWGDRAGGWEEPVEVRTPTGYLACRSERFYYVVHSTCFVLERDQEPRSVPCDTPIFDDRGARWDFVTNEPPALVDSPSSLVASPEL